ncbi:MAG: transposase [Emticicia sp.]|nr:transposase [Emticicia sp.]
MAVKTRQDQRATIYFVTFTCHKWLPLFEETKLYDNIYGWFKLLNEKGIKTVGYVLMPNHLHCMLYLPKEAPELYKIISNAKRFMAYEIVKRLEQEGKKELLAKLEEGVKAKEGKKGKLHQVFKESYDAKECFNEPFIRQKLDYMHKNPVSGRWNLASDYLLYPHSSARFYDLNEINEFVVLTHYQDV